MRHAEIQEIVYNYFKERDLFYRGTRMEHANNLAQLLVEANCKHPLAYREVNHDEGNHWYSCGICGAEMPGDPVADRAEAAAEREMDQDR